MLGSRPCVREGSTGCRKVRTERERERERATAAPKPLRARKTATLSPPDGYTVIGAPSRPAKLVRAASHAAVNDYLPPYAYTEYTEQRKTARQSARARGRRCIRRGARSRFAVYTDRSNASVEPAATRRRPRPRPARRWWAHRSREGSVERSVPSRPPASASQSRRPAARRPSNRLLVDGLPIRTGADGSHLAAQPESDGRSGNREVVKCPIEKWRCS